MEVYGDKCDGSGNACDIKLQVYVEDSKGTQYISPISPSVRQGQASVKYETTEATKEDSLRPARINTINKEENVILRIKILDEDGYGTLQGDDDLLYEKRIEVSRKFLNNGGGWVQTYWDDCDKTYCDSARVDFMIYAVPPS